MKTYGGLEVHIHVFLTSALVGGEWSASFLCRFSPGESAPGTRGIGGWVVSRAGLDVMEKILDHTGTRTPNPGRPLLCQSLYWLRYHTLRKLKLKWLHVRVDILSAVVMKRIMPCSPLDVSRLSEINVTATFRLNKPRKNPEASLLPASC
jgi:hypothetical protein